MKTCLLLGVCLFALSCSSSKYAYEKGDLVMIKHGKDVFKIDSAEYRKPKAYANWNSGFYRVTHLVNGKSYSLPQQSLVLFEKNQTQPANQRSMIAQSKSKKD